MDKAQHPELRHTVLSLMAFRDLKEAIAAHGNDCDDGYRRLMAELAAEQTQGTDRPDAVPPSAAGPAVGAGPSTSEHRPTDLFGNPIYPNGKKKR